ncbi:hypothetical protein ANANG_G00073310 [Anguilla anguilla]|uniref:Tetratricopeptide repeat protein 1 n=1 Tax=Anguilla anguilla TaxID=7936 RepID=A0A9D3MSU8_ANGAN|nr:hypothetical protein ANANG_G00073310 [Anguilla anguilla]
MLRTSAEQCCSTRERNEDEEKTEVYFKTGRVAPRCREVFFGDGAWHEGGDLFGSPELPVPLGTARGSRRGADGHAATPPDAPEQDEDSFFDCPEVLEEESASHRGGPGGGGEERGHGDGRDGPEDGEREEGGSEGEEWEDLGVACGVQGEEWTECGEQNAGGGGEESRAEFREEGEEDLAEHGKDDSDSELKEEAPVEFDEEYLRELEKDLSEEEKESRRQESLLLKETGNGQFKKGEHTEAEASYTAALGVCPVCYSKERSILFSNRAAARVHLDQKEKAIADCTKDTRLSPSDRLNPDYVRAILRRAELYEKTDKLDEALEDYKSILEKDPGVHQAREACMVSPRTSKWQE